MQNHAGTGNQQAEEISVERIMMMIEENYIRDAEGHMVRKDQAVDGVVPKGEAIHAAAKQEYLSRAKITPGLHRNMGAWRVMVERRWGRRSWVEGRLSTRL